MKNDQKVFFEKTARLADKQSVRTTFKLSNECVDVLNQILEKNNLKPKELFEHIFLGEFFGEIIDSISKKGMDKNLSVQRIRKTFVLSKGALRTFNKRSKKLEISRDLLVERLILITKAFLDKIAENEKKEDEKSLSIMSDFMEKVYETEDKLRSLHREDNPILERFSFGVVVMECLKGAIKSKVESGVPISPDDINQS